MSKGWTPKVIMISFAWKSGKKILNAFKQEIVEKNNIKNKFLIIIPPIF